MVKHSGFIVILLLAGLVLLAAYPSRAQINAGMPVKEDPPIEGIMDFSRCVGLALQQSPYLTSSSLEIDVKRLDASDAKYSYIPTFSLRTQYYINAPPPINGYTFKPYIIQFITDPYNPIEVYFNVRARKYVTQVAVYAHLQIISDYLQRLALGFLQLEPDAAQVPGAGQPVERANDGHELAERARRGAKDVPRHRPPLCQLPRPPLANAYALPAILQYRRSVSYGRRRTLRFAADLGGEKDVEWAVFPGVLRLG